MFKLFVAKPNFFSIIIVGLLLFGVFWFDHANASLTETIVVSGILVGLSFGVNVFSISKSKLVHYTIYQLLFLAIFLWISDMSLLTLPIAFAYFFISLIHFELNAGAMQKSNGVFVALAILAFVANVCFFPTISFTLVLLIYAITSGQSSKALIQFLATYFFCALVVVQLLYLLDSLDSIQTYFCNISIFKFRWYADRVYLIPMGIFILLAWVDHFSKTAIQSLEKRNLYNLYVILFILQLLALFIFSEEYSAQLAFLYFPVGIFIGRFVYYIKNPYIQNILMILSLAAIALLKIYSYNFL